MTVMLIDRFGWKIYQAKARNALPEGDFDIARVCVENKNGYGLWSKHGELSGILRGKVLSQRDGAGFPKVGDWVTIQKLPNEDKAVIEEVLPRATKISRKDPEQELEQVIVANVDVVFIVQGMPEDFNLRRLERYLTIARLSGAQPVVVLNKIDLHSNYLEAIAEARAVALDAPVIAVSAKTNHGMDELKSFLQPGMTFVFLGSSGVGKSSLVNALIGKDLQATQEIRDSDSRGRHTTTRREMIQLNDGSILIDTPGMRELALWAEEEELMQSFEDVEELALQCRYTDCDHEKSEDCAVQAALSDGTLAQERFNGFIKLKKEMEYLASKTDKAKMRERKNSSKSLSKRITKRLK
jgi:ribosome biogenesis GTPase